MSEAKILVATHGTMAQVRVIGRASFACSQSLRDFADRVAADDVKRFVVDVSECTTMDSTFMGVMAMVVTRNRDRNVTLEVVNASEKVKKLLVGLGLRALFCFSRTAGGSVDWAGLCQATAEDAGDDLALEKTILEAHEALVDIDEGNAPKFRDVVDFLRQDLEERTGRGD